jgi:LDH2 family malate/lactate/ureidoglycolate dehydrogenase
MTTSHSLQANYLHALTRRLFMAVGAPRHIADDVAEILVNANLAGHDSHGVLRIPTYLKQIEAGAIQPAAEPQVVQEGPNRLLVDGQGGFGHYTARTAMNLAIDKARRETVCCVSFARVGHIGRLGEYAEAAARAGCIGLITVGGGSRQNIGRTVPHGGVVGVLGTNPIAIGVPTGDETPFILDYATSMVAEGKLQVARSKNLDVPEGTILDQQGNPSVKPADFYDGGFLLPFGRHKGYALSLFTCLLGGLSGNFDPAHAAMGGGFMQVLHVEAFTPLAAYQQNVRAFLDGMKSTPPAPGFAEVLVPGDVERRSRSQRLADGIEIPDTIYSQLRTWAEQLNVPLSESIVEPTDTERYTPGSPG